MASGACWIVSTSPAGYRALRWTHHVRQLALARLGDTGRKLARLDPIMDITNITLWVVAVVALVAAG